MEVRILKYTGPKESGSIIVRQEKMISPWRKIKVFPGAEWEIGREMPETVAKHITSMMRHSFNIETIQLDNNGEVLHNISVFLEGYKKRFGNDANSVLPALTVEAILGVCGEGALPSILSALDNSSKVSPEEREKLGMGSKSGVEVERASENKEAEPEAMESEGTSEGDDTGGTELKAEVSGKAKKTAPKRAPAAKPSPPERKK